MTPLRYPHGKIASPNREETNLWMRNASCAVKRSKLRISGGITRMVHTSRGICVLVKNARTASMSSGIAISEAEMLCMPHLLIGRRPTQSVMRNLIRSTGSGSLKRSLRRIALGTRCAVGNSRGFRAKFAASLRESMVTMHPTSLKIGTTCAGFVSSATRWNTHHLSI